MSERIPAEVLSELERLEKAATPGPWKHGVEFDEETGEEIGSLSIHSPDYIQVWNGETNEVSDTVAVLGFSAHTKHRANLAFIMALRNHAPALIAAAREAEELRRNLGIVKADAKYYRGAINNAIQVLMDHFFAMEPQGDLPQEPSAGGMLSQCVESVLAQSRESKARAEKAEAENAELRAESEGRRKALLEIGKERRVLWQQKENLEAENARLAKVLDWVEAHTEGKFHDEIVRARGAK